MAQKSNNGTELDDIDYVKRVDKHDEDIISVKTRLEALENKFGTNEKIADTLCDTDEKASKFSEMMEKRFVKLLQADGDSKKQIKSIVSDQLKQNWKAFALSTGGKIAFAVWTIVTIVLGVWLGHIWK